MTSAKLYCLDGKSSFWHAHAEGENFIVTSGPIEGPASKFKTKATPKKDASAAVAAVEKATAKKREDCYVTATELELERLRDVAATRRGTFEVGGEVGKWNFQQLGGTPRGLSPKKWPVSAKEPLGHLVCVACPEAIKKARAVAVFVRPTAAAMDNDVVVAVPLTDGQMMKDPVEAPSGVVVIEPRALEDVLVDDYEVNASVTEPLSDVDGAFAARVEDLKKFIGEPTPLLTKAIGAPEWLRDEAWVQDPDGTPWKFIAQVDFREFGKERVAAAWPDADVAGVLYVFVSPDEEQARAVWQS